MPCHSQIFALSRALTSAGVIGRQVKEKYMLYLYAVEDKRLIVFVFLNQSGTLCFVYAMHLVNKPYDFWSVAK